MTIRQLARKYLSRRWDQQVEQFPLMRETTPKTKYVSVNLPYLTRGDYWPARLRSLEEDLSNDD